MDRRQRKEGKTKRHAMIRNHTARFFTNTYTDLHDGLDSMSEFSLKKDANDKPNEIRKVELSLTGTIEIIHFWRRKII